MLPRRIMRLAPTVAVVPALLAGSAHQQGASPRLTPIDSIVLAETESQFVGQVAALAISPAGRYFLLDRANFTIHEYARDGRFVRRFGRQGRGPGEFHAPSAFAVAGDSLLLVFGGSELQAFDLRSGTLAWQRRLPRVPHALATGGGRVYMSWVDLAGGSSTARLRSATDSLVTGGPIPSPYGRHQAVDMTFGRVTSLAALGSDSVVLAFHATDYVFLGRIGTTRFDSIRVSRLHRNGARPDLIARIVSNPDILRDAAYALSAPWAMTRLADGQLAIVTVDQQFSGGRLSGQLFLSIIDPVRRRTCPDARIPGPADPPSRVAFAGDTLVVAEQDAGSAGDARTTIRKYSISTAGCRWME